MSQSPPPTTPIAENKALATIPPNGLLSPANKLPDSIKKFLYFVDVDMIQAVLEEEGWEPTDELRYILQVIKDPDISPTLKLRAIKQLIDIKRYAMERSGLVITALRKAVNQESGDTAVLSTKKVASLLTGTEDSFEAKKLMLKPKTFNLGKGVKSNDSTKETDTGSEGGTDLSGSNGECQQNPADDTRRSQEAGGSGNERDGKLPDSGGSPDASITADPTAPNPLAATVGATSSSGTRTNNAGSACSSGREPDGSTHKPPVSTFQLPGLARPTPNPKDSAGD